MAATDATSLGKAASAFQQLHGFTGLVQIWLLQQIAGNTMTANQLIAAASPLQQIQAQGLQDLVIIYLLTQIVTGGTGGGGGGISSGTGAPSAPPSSTAAIYIDNSTGNLWVYFNGAWVFTGITA